MTDERRVRAEYDGVVTLKTAAGQEISSAKCRNVSLSGVFVESATNLPLNSPCEVEMTLRGSDPVIALHMKGHVARVSEEGMGIAFEVMDIDTLEHLKRLVLYNARDPHEFLKQCEKRMGFK